MPAALCDLEGLLFELIKLFCRKPLVAVRMLVEVLQLTDRALLHGEFKLMPYLKPELVCRDAAGLALNGCLLDEFLWSEATLARCEHVEGRADRGPDLFGLVPVFGLHAGS